MPPIVVAVAQSLKGTLGVREVAEAFRRGIAAAGAEPRVIPASDGGDGLLQALGPLVRRRTQHACHGPLNERLAVEVGWLDAEAAVVESRLICGLGLVPPEMRDPERTTTRGVGEVLAEVAASGARQIFVGLGGSATMDGGLGMARAWGWRPAGPGGAHLPDGGGALVALETLGPGKRPGARVVGLADVRCALLGPAGAARFAPQKGADPESAARLMTGLERLVAATDALDGCALAEREGAGSAGGLGFGILCFAAGDLVPGAPWVLDRVGFDAALDDAALVVTGEGAFDATSLAGKLTGEVLERARAARLPAAVLAPTARDVPDGVFVQSAPGRWSAPDLEQHTSAVVRRALRLPPP